MEPSSHWRVTVETEDASLEPSGPGDALKLARDLSDGELGATGDKSDYVELQFDREYALVFYVTPEGTTLRPRFPNSEVSGDGVDELFCEDCGVQLDDDFSQCTNRENGFSICEAILAGRLPQSADIQWVPLRNGGKHDA
jgi:hypothetical protein